MRRKNDTLIKYFQLANTMFLTNEEFGALVRKIMIEDDKNEIRYENIDEETKEDLKRLEKKWKEDFNNLKKKNPLVASANASMSIQVKKSTKSFNDLVNKIENKKKTTETKTEETTTKKQKERQQERQQQKQQQKQQNKKIIVIAKTDMLSYQKKHTKK